MTKRKKRQGDAETRGNGDLLSPRPRDPVSPHRSPSPRHLLSASPNHAYTLIEVLVAAGLLVFAIAAAASLAGSMLAQEESNARIARALNYQEQAGRLYHLGDAVTNITTKLPTEPAVDSLDFTTGSTNLAGVDLETAECVLTFSGGERTNTVFLVRPTAANQ